MGLTRREFVRTGALGLASTAVVPVWLANSSRASTQGDPLLAVVFLRGAADALHLVPPIGDSAYARLRGPLALANPRPFAPGFGLHPELENAAPLAERGQLAVVLDAGSPHSTRSHFEAQDFMEAGEPGSLRMADGWMARALGRGDAFASVALTSRLPLTLRGSGSFALGDAFGIPGADRKAREQLQAGYARQGGALGDAGVSALQALSEYERRVGRTSPRRARRRGRPGGVFLAQAAQRLVELERSGLRLRAVFLESSGWDTHNNQGVERGQMAGWIRDLGDALGRLATGLEGRRDWLCCVMTEFGRTVRPNGSGGTDHGHGSAMLVAGPRVRGGLYGDWRGLEPADLWEGRDLPVTTDYRSVLFEVLAAHLGAAPPTTRSCRPRHRSTKRPPASHSSRS